LARLSLLDILRGPLADPAIAGVTDMTVQPSLHAESSAATAKKNSAQFVGFQIEDQDYAFPIEQIREIVVLDKVTRTPQVPDYCEGVSNLRGAIIPIINVRKLFGLGPRPADGESRIIVVQVGEKTMGCTVDTVSQVIRIPQESIQPAPETITAGGADYISGFARIDGRVIIVLNISELLNPEQLDRIRQVPTIGTEEATS
jgi:purine-binding chemotaxis protein CheW